MATKLTKKQQTQLTEKLAGIVQRESALQLRLSMDNSVNEMNVNQISGALNRIHGQAIGKDLPTEITIPVKQLGSGDPSPDNVRPIVGYQIDGIGTVYGGELNIESGVLTLTYRNADLAGMAWTTRATGNINKVYSGSLSKSYIAATGLLPWYCDIYPQGEPTNAPLLINDVDTAQRAVYSFKTSPGAATITIYIVESKGVKPEGNLVYKIANPETYTLTPEQMIQLLDQL